VDTLSARKRSLKLSVDAATRWIIKQGFEEPPLINAVGSGYVVGDVLTLSGGTSTTAATLTVMKVGGAGEIELLEITERGVYTAFPANPVSLTGGTGTGASADIANDGAKINGRAFSLSPTAQTNWTNAMLNAANAVYPIHFPDLADASYAQLDNAADVAAWYAAGFNSIRKCTSEGAVTKASIAAQADEASAKAIYTGDTRKTHWGVSPPDFDTI